MNDKTEITYLNLWKDICFYETYKDKILYEEYLIHLSNKYSVDTNTIIIKINEVKKEANKKIKEYHKRQKDYQPLFKTECEEEKIKTIIEYNRRRREIKEEIYDGPSLKVNEIKKLEFLKTRK